MAAYVIAGLLDTSAQPILAPLTALLVVQLTMYETVTHGWERIVSVATGVAVAATFASVVGLTWWSLGAVVAVSLVAGRLLRLGPHLLEVPITAMLVLAVGGAESAAAARVVETLIGAVVGVLVNLVIAPPLYIQPASAAISELAERMSGYAHELAAALRGEWSRATADQFLGRARELGAEVARADRGLARTERSARLNPRGRLARQAQPRLRGTLTALEHAQIGLRNLARALLDRTYFVPAEAAGQAYSEPVRTALADVLDEVAAAVAAVVPVAGGSGGDAAAREAAAREAVTAHLAEVERRRDRLGALLYVDPRTDPAAWQQHGALLAAIDRLRVEIEAAVRSPATTWRPDPLGARQREALRRTLSAAHDSAVVRGALENLDRATPRRPPPTPDPAPAPTPNEAD